MLSSIVRPRLSADGREAQFIISIEKNFMRKAELALAIAKNAELNQKQAQEVVTAFTDQVAQAMARGQTVTLPGFGVFSVRQRSARTGRNPQTGEALSIPASQSVGFKPGKQLKEAVGG